MALFEEGGRKEKKRAAPSSSDFSFSLSLSLSSSVLPRRRRETEAKEGEKPQKRGKRTRACEEVLKKSFFLLFREKKRENKVQQRVFGPQEEGKTYKKAATGETKKPTRHQNIQQKSHEETKKPGFNILEERNNSTLTNFS